MFRSRREPNSFSISLMPVEIATSAAAKASSISLGTVGDDPDRLVVDGEVGAAKSVTVEVSTVRINSVRFSY